MPKRRAGVRRVDRIGIRRLVGVRPVLADEVVAALDARGREEPVQRRVLGIGRPGAVGGLEGVQRAGAAERGVGVVEAGVEDGDVDPGALVALGLDRRRADVGHGLGQVHLVVLDGLDRDDGRVLGQSREVGGGDLQHDEVAGPARATEDLDLRVEPLGLRDDPVLLRARRLEGGLLGRRARGDLDGGRSGEAHHDTLPRRAGPEDLVDLGRCLVAGQRDRLVELELGDRIRRRRRRTIRRVDG